MTKLALLSGRYQVPILAPPPGNGLAHGRWHLGRLGCRHYRIHDLPDEHCMFTRRQQGQDVGDPCHRVGRTNLGGFALLVMRHGLHVDPKACGKALLRHAHLLALKPHFVAGHGTRLANDMQADGAMQSGTVGNRGRPAIVGVIREGDAVQPVRFGQTNIAQMVGLCQPGASLDVELHAIGCPARSLKA